MNTPPIQVTLSDGATVPIGHSVIGLIEEPSGRSLIFGDLVSAGSHGYLVSTVGADRNQRYICAAAFSKDQEDMARNFALGRSHPDPVPKPPPFWMVVNVSEARGRRDFFENPLPGSELPEHHRPRAMHDTEASASAELLRLAKTHPEGRFVLLEAVAFADGRLRQKVETVTEFFVEPIKG